jgi:protein-disulfide isomerase
MKKSSIIVLLALALALPLGAGGKKDQEGITREQADEILKELRQIRELLEKGARPGSGDAAEVRMNLEGGPWLGNKDAPFTLVEFTDYQCSYCRQFHLSTFPELKKQYIDTGRLRFASRDMPLDFHSNAAHAAEAARCAGEQGMFWELRDRLITHADRLAPADIGGYAREIKLDALQFQNCLASGKYADVVKKDVATAEGFGVNGTPTFLLGKSTPDGVSGVILVGALPFAAFEARLKALVE